MRRTRTSWAAARAAAVAMVMMRRAKTIRPWGAAITGRSSVGGGRSTSFRMRHNHRRCCPNASTVGEVMPPRARTIYWQEHENEEGVAWSIGHEMLSLDEWTVPDFCNMLKLPAPESVRG